VPAPFAALEARVNAVALAKLANVTATWNGTTAVDGIFDDAYVSPLDVTAAAAPRFVCLESAVPGVAFAQTLLVSATAYRIVGIRPDGRGIVELKLERS
jgi:hypothetical protein